MLSVMEEARLGDADSDHSCADGGDDGDKRRDAQPGQAAEGAREGEEQADEHTDEHEYDGAGGVVGDGVHHYAEGEDVRSHDKDNEDQLARPEKFAPEAPEEDVACVAHGVDFWVDDLELPDYEACVGS